MVKLKEVRTETNYDAALARISGLLGAEPYSSDDQELDWLSTGVERYENVNYPMEKPEPHSLLEFLLDQKIVTRQRAILLVGDADALDQMLLGRKEIPVELAQLLQEHSGIAAEDLMLPSVMR